MTTKTRINPATGMAETYDDRSDTELRVKILRREVKDMIAGNVQFHQDELGKKPADPTDWPFPETEGGA